jgi:hypothetical protein
MLYCTHLLYDDGPTITHVPYDAAGYRSIEVLREDTLSDDRGRVHGGVMLPDGVCDCVEGRH